jgi:hypothetical protein
MKPLMVSPDFPGFSPLCACDGENLSPVIRPEGCLPNRLQSWFLIHPGSPAVRSHYGSAKTSRWCQSSLPASPAGVSLSRPFLQYREYMTRERSGRAGPCPPPGPMIRYLSGAYGLDAMPGLPAGSDKNALIAAMKGHVPRFAHTVALSSR